MFSKAVNKARTPSEPKGITVLDFDDTLATTESLVKFTRPDGTTGTLNAEEYASTYQDNTPAYADSSDNIDRGGEYREFAAKVLKGDVKNYLRLGNAAWAEKRLERAAEHFRKATEINPDEPRAWHNLAVCNYHLALKRNPDDVEGAVESAFEPLKIAKEKGGSEYTSVNKTLAFLASQIGIEED